MVPASPLAVSNDAADAGDGSAMGGKATIKSRSAPASLPPLGDERVDGGEASGAVDTG